MSEQKIRKIIREGLGGDDYDSIASAKTKAMDMYNPDEEWIEDMGEEKWNSLSHKEKEEMRALAIDGRNRQMSEVVKITKSQLENIIKEGVSKLHKKTLIESRLSQINDQLNSMNKPESWDEVNKNSENQRRRQNIAWNEMSPSAINENEDNKINTVKKFLDATEYNKGKNWPSVTSLKSKMKELNISEDLKIDLMSFFKYDHNSK